MTSFAVLTGVIYAGMWVSGGVLCAVFVGTLICELVRRPAAAGCLPGPGVWIARTPVYPEHALGVCGPGCPWCGLEPAACPAAGPVTVPLGCLQESWVRDTLAWCEARGIGPAAAGGQP